MGTTDPVTRSARLADRLARLIRVPPISLPVGRDEASFVAFRALLSEMYPSTHQHLERELFADGCILFRWPGGGGPSTLLMAHYDVVPVAEGDWTRPPFGGEIDDGVMYGRGGLDDKGPLFVILEAVESLLAEGITPDGDVYLSFGDDEEIGGPHAKTVADLVKSRGVCPDLVVDEGGAVVSGMVPAVAVCHLSQPTSIDTRRRRKPRHLQSWRGRGVLPPPPRWKSARCPRLGDHRLVMTGTARRMSVELNISNPPATHTPFTAAMIGWYTGNRCRTA